MKSSYTFYDCILDYMQIMPYHLMELQHKQKYNVRKPLAKCANQPAGCVLLKKLRYFKVMLNIFAFSRLWEIAESWLIYANSFTLIAQPNFLTEIKKTNIVSASFSCVLEFLWKKISMHLSIISMYRNETNI